MGSPRLAISAALLLALGCSCSSRQSDEPRLVIELPDPSSYDATPDETPSEVVDESNYDHLRKKALSILQSGVRSRDPETLLLTVFGAGVSADHQTLPILLRALESNHPQIQMAALNFLTSWNHDQADTAIRRAMGSPFLITRLQAARHLAGQKTPTAAGQIEALMAKAPEEIAPVFPQLYGMMGDSVSQQQLRRLMMHENQQVRVEAILSAARYNLRDLLPVIRVLSTHLDPIQQEACCAAFEAFGDDSALPRLLELAESQSTHVRLAALKALLRFGNPEARGEIEKLARKGNAFAIQLLGALPNSEDLLNQLMLADNLNLQVNAATALLEKRDDRCLQVLPEVLLRDARDLALQQVTTPGRTLNAWKLVPSASSNFARQPFAYELSIRYREMLLAQTAELSQPSFLSLADLIISSNQWELIPTTIQLLENRRSTEAIALLEKHYDRVGAPLIRWWCNLALYKMEPDPKFETALLAWLEDWQEEELIQFRPMLSWEQELDKNPHQLTPDEGSRLLVETFEALAQKRNDAALKALLNSIENGNPKNSYPLAGLLLRMVQ